MISQNLKLVNCWFEFINQYLDGGNFRTATLFLLGFVFLFQLILIQTSYGNHLFAIGGNSRAAIAQGVRANRTRVMAFVLNGFLAGAAGIIGFSQFKSVRVAEQSGIELTAIAASVIGGAVLTGGYGSVWGALIGIILINLLRSGVILMKIPFIPADNFPAVVGVTIVAATVINYYLRSRSTS